MPTNFFRRCLLDPCDAPWVESIQKRVLELPARHTQSSHLRDIILQPPTIFKVPDNIRECDPDAYNSYVVSLGPFNNRNPLCPSNEQSMQKYKWLCVQFLISRHSEGEQAKWLLNQCLAAMKEHETRARKCYAGDISPHLLPSNEFSEMLLLDGCFVLRLLMRHWEKHDLKVVIHDKPTLKTMQMDEEALALGGLWIWSLAKFDLLKLENQIPFFVLETLFDLLKTPSDACTDVAELAFEFLGSFNLHIMTATCKPIISNHQIHHLLHLHHICIAPSLNRKQATTNPTPQWIPSANELREAGVKFKHKPNAKSFMDVTFSKGVMEIPTLNVCKRTSSVFRNLIAFEQCFPVLPYVTNYAFLMDCLLHCGTNNVRFLHLKGILINRQNSDKETACFFNNLCKQIHYGFENNYLQVLFADVMRYNDFKWHRWRAGLVRDYFSNPWVIVSVIVAILLLILAVEQSFFAAYSYYIPQK